MFIKRSLYSSLAWVMILCMAFSLIPVTAQAEGGETELDVVNGNIIITENGYFQGTGEWTEDDLTGASSYTIKGNSSSKNHIVVESGTIDITLDNLTVCSNSAFAPAIKVESGAAVNLTLVGNNDLRCTDAQYAAINVPEGASLTIGGTGSLTAIGGIGSAGIGGNSGQNAGSISINSGSIIANGGASSTGTGAGIGGGAGISGGNWGNGGIISISGGYVNASAPGTEDGNVSAYIGGGSNGGSGTISISGGCVYACEDNSSYDAGTNHIGHGEGYTGTDGSVTISGGSVQAGQLYSTEIGAQVRPVPKNENGNELRQVEIYLDADEYADYFKDAEIISLSIKDSGNTKYNYGTNDLFYNYSMYFWLPVGEYTATATVKMGSSFYDLSGTISVPEDMDQRSGELKATSSYTDTITLDIGSTSSVTYNGQDQTPAAVVKNKSGTVLTEGSDYELGCQKLSSSSETDYEDVTEIKNAGSYRICANGKGSYAGMSDYKDFHINPIEVNVTYNGEAFTKEYDGTKAVKNSKVDTVKVLNLDIDESVVLLGDSITDVKMLNPEYVQAGVGTDIEIAGSQITCTGNDNHNYILNLSPILTGDIKAKIIGESSISQGSLKISKTYDGTVSSANAEKTGNLVLTGINGEKVTVSVTGYGDYNSEDAGDNKSVEVSLGSLSGANSANYTLAGGATTFTAAASITAADYYYTVTETQNDIPQSSGLSAIMTPSGGVGANGEVVAGVLEWYRDAARTQEAVDTDVSSLAIGNSATLYLSFTSSDPNYINTPKTGSVTLTIAEGERQDLSFDVTTVVKTYGDTDFRVSAANTSENGGAISYSSSNTVVAAVYKSSGEVSILGAGLATITASAEAVPDKWSRTTASYVLTVNKKAVTVSADDKSKVYGEDNPKLTFTVADGTLVENDSKEDLGVSLSCAASKTSPAGTPVAITGIGAVKSNYDVTVSPGELTINKAQAPTINDLNKTLLYSTGHSNVTMNIAAIEALPADRGESTYQVGSVTDADSILNGTPAVDANGLLTFSVNSGEKGQSAVIPLTVKMQNYSDVTINVTVSLVEKIPVTISGVRIANKEYDGRPVTPVGTPSAVYENDQIYSGTFEYWYEGADYTASTVAPKDAGRYTLTVKVPDSNTQYMGAAKAMDFTIKKRALIVKPSSHSIYKGKQLPAPTVVYEHLADGDVGAKVVTLARGSLKMEIKAADGTAKLADSSTQGSYEIKFIGSLVFKEAKNYTITTADGTLTIKRHSSGGGGHGGSASTGTTSQPDVKVDKNGTATIDLSSKKGTTEASISAETISQAAKSHNKDSAMVLKLSEAELLIDSKALDSIAKQVNGKDIKVSVEPVKKHKNLNSKQRDIVGDRPVYDISLKSGNKAISSFGKGKITVSLSYELKKGEDANNIVVWHLDDNGNISKMSCTYDAVTKTVSFTTSHFSYYVIAYDEVSSILASFADVDVNAWYAKNVAFVVKNKLFSGISSKTFAPEDKMTRAMLVTVLNRLDGNTKAGEISFTDVKAGTWYTDAVAWAAANDIISGIGNDQFGPDEDITREQMAAIIYRYAEYKGYDVSVSTSLDSFKDAEHISSWSRDAVKWAVGAELISGKGNGIIDPGAGASRAEVAAILQRFIENVR